MTTNNLSTQGEPARFALTLAERTRLEKLETTIEAGIQTFVEVGLALAEIRDNKLYRGTHTTFDTYLAERWHFTRQRAAQLIAAAKVAGTLSTTVDVSERALRPLAKVDPADRKDVFTKAKVLAGEGRVTVKHVETAIGKATIRHNNQGLWSILRRQYPDLYAKVKDGEMTLDQAQLIHIDNLAADRRESEEAARGEVRARLGLDHVQETAERLVLGPPRNGMDFARMAVMDLEQIRPDDAERARAFAFVRDVIGKLTPDMVPPTDAAAHPRERVLSAVTGALWIYQNDATAGRRGKPGPADRKRIRFEVEGILREFTKGTLKPRIGNPTHDVAPGSTPRAEDDLGVNPAVSTYEDSTEAVGA